MLAPPLNSVPLPGNELKRSMPLIILGLFCLLTIPTLLWNGRIEPNSEISDPHR